MNSVMDNGILRGAPLGPLPQCSWPEYILPKLRSMPKDKILQVEAETGNTQTSGQLLSASICLAEGLMKIGLQVDDVVGMLCRNSLDACNIVLATWLSGGVVAPINGSMKPLELKHSLEVANPKIVFCDDDMIDSVDTALGLFSNTATVFVVGGKPDLCHRCRSFEEIPVKADIENYKPPLVQFPSSQLAAILPSSGTSSLSKGVGVTHTNLIFQDMNLDHLQGFKEGQDFLQVSHFYWITGILAFMKTLTIGTKRIMLKNVNDLNILKAIDKYKIQCTIIAPLSLYALTNHPEFDRYDTSSIKTIWVGGSVLTPFVGRKLQEKFAQATIIQGYGTTESTGIVTSTNGEGDIFSVGKVTPGAQIKVCDVKTNEILKANVQGEVRVKSLGNMKEYVRNEEATKAALDDMGWIRTGDLGYYDDSGQLYLVDRIKDMIKVRNLQVAPVEIENIILGIPGVLEVGVTGIPSQEDFDRIVAIVKKDPGVPLNEKDIHLHVESNLSDFKKITGGVYFVESVPKTPGGKIKRGELKKLASSLVSTANCS